MTSGDSSSGNVKDGEKLRWALPPPSTIVYHFGTSGISVATATCATHPLDVLKVRLQMQLVGKRGPLTKMVYIYNTSLKDVFLLDVNANWMSTYAGRYLYPTTEE